MTAELFLSLGSKLTKIFRLFGKLEFVQRLHDFLVHEGRRSRAQILAQTADVVIKLEMAEAERLKNSQTLMELMQSAGFSDEKIQAVLCDPQEMQRVSIALTTMLHYVDTGAVTISVISEPASQKPTANSMLLASELYPNKKRIKRDGRARKRGKRGGV